MLGAAVLFGTGLGIAFFMWMAHRSRDPATIARIAEIVVVADALFTAGAVILQPFTGALLAWALGYSAWESWIVASLGLYVLVGLCWLPVIGIQLELRNLARAAAAAGRATAGALSPAVPHLVRARLARFHRRGRDLRADDFQAPAVVTP